MYAKFLLQAILVIYIFISSILCKDFKVYWNIPSFMCRRFKTQIPNVTEQFGIIQNYNDDFRGNQIAILYDPGNFPAIILNKTTKNYIYRNNGIPQNGDLQDHLNKFDKELNKLIPNTNFSGIGVIDFELWRPIYRQNFGALQPYKDLSKFTERQLHPFWDDYRIDVEASNRFERYAKMFILETLRHAKNLRPNAKWGYYGLPFCFNGRGKNIKDCADYVKKENNGMQWLIDESDVVLPSVYMNEDLAPSKRVPMIQGRISEAMRMADKVKSTNKPEVYVYYRYLFVDTLRYLTESEALEALSAIKSSGAEGVILWGSSHDLNTRAKCDKFYKYLVNTLGPVIESLQPSFSVGSPSNNDVD